MCCVFASLSVLLILFCIVYVCFLQCDNVDIAVFVCVACFLLCCLLCAVDIVCVFCV